MRGNTSSKFLVVDKDEDTRLDSGVKQRYEKARIILQVINAVDNLMRHLDCVHTV